MLRRDDVALLLLRRLPSLLYLLRLLHARAAMFCAVDYAPMMLRCLMFIISPRALFCLRLDVAVLLRQPFTMTPQQYVDARCATACLDTRLLMFMPVYYITMIDICRDDVTPLRIRCRLFHDMMAMLDAADMLSSRHFATPPCLLAFHTLIFFSAALAMLITI